MGACRGNGLRELDSIDPKIRKAHAERLRRRSLGELLSNDDQREMNKMQFVELVSRLETLELTSGESPAPIPGAGGPDPAPSASSRGAATHGAATHGAATPAPSASVAPSHGDSTSGETGTSASKVLTGEEMRAKRLALLKKK